MSVMDRVAKPATLRSAAAPVALVAGGLVMGLVLGQVGAEFGPVAVLAPLVVYVLLVLTLGRPAWGIAVLVLSLPVGMIALPPTPFQVVELAAGVAFVLVVISDLAAGRRALAWSPPAGWLVALVGLTLLSASQAIDPVAATGETVKLILGLGLVLASLAALRDERDLRFVVVILLLVGAVICGLGARGFSSVSADFGGALVEGRSRGIFAQPNELGTFSAMISALAAGVWSTGRDRRLRRLAFVCGAAAGVALLASLSRGAWIGTALALGVIAWLQPRARRAYLTLAVPLVIGGGALFVFASEAPQVSVVRERFESFGDPTGNPYDDRPSIYREAFRQIRERPLTGFGPAGFPTASARRIEQGSTIGAAHAHNTLLAVATELGIPAVLVLLGATGSIAAAVRRALRRFREHGRDGLAALTTGGTAGVIVIAGQGLVDYSLRNPILFFTVWLMLSITLAGTRIAGRLDRR